MTVFEYFEPSVEDRARLDAAPFRGTDEAGWRAFASGVLLQVIAAYREGDITLERALEALWSCSVGCNVQDRIRLTALASRLALLNQPVQRKRTAGQLHPKWVRY